MTMPIDTVSQARRAQGRFAVQRGARLPAAAEAYRPLVRPLAQAGLRICNAHPLVTASLLLSVLAPRTGPALLPGAQGVAPGTPAGGTLNEVLEHLVPVNQIAPCAGGPAASLVSIGNAAVGTCVAAPRRCPQALLVSSLAGATVLAGAAVDSAVEALWRTADDADLAPGVAHYDAAGRVLDQLLPHDRRALLTLLRDCADAPTCTAPLRALLLSLPAQAQQGIKDAVAPATPDTPDTPAAGWPPAAQAIAPPSPLSWVDATIALLEGVYDPVRAAYLLDLEYIAQATMEAQSGQPRGTREVVANQQRSAAIEALFNATGHPLESLPFTLSAHDLRGVPRTAWGRNLLLTFAGPGTPEHTLMLVAHGDMTGTDTGSSGALDNGTGVAALLALARELHDTDLPRGTQVQLLVTDQGERGMMGAKAHVQRCLAQRCPDAVLNLDMLGHGDGLAICGSEQRHLFVMDTQRTDQRHPGAVDAHETHLRQLLQRAATDLGVRQHPYTAWTQVSDHLPFQREGIAALGLTRMNAAELRAEAHRQATYAELLRRHAAVDWTRMDDYLNGRLSRIESDDMRDRLAEHAAVSRQYRRLGDSAYRGTVHNGHDQMGQIRPRAALETLDVVRRTVHAWLANPAP